MESQNDTDDPDSILLFDFQTKLECFFRATHPTIGNRLSQIIQDGQYYLNGVRDKYEKSLQPITEMSSHEDLKGQTNRIGSLSSPADSKEPETLLTDIASSDPEIKKSTDEIPSILSKYFFVKDDERFKCGIMQCGKITVENKFFAHLVTHDSNHPFICVHCNENVGYGRSEAVRHMYLHYQYLYYCITCKYARSSRFLMVLHFLKKHLDVDVQFWYKDQVLNETKLVNLTYLCMECDTSIRAPKYLAAHFHDYHESQMIDFELTADFRDQLCNKYLVRRQLKCARCNISYGTKAELIEHHRNKHASAELNIKLGNFDLFSMQRMLKAQIEIYSSNNARNDRNIIFHCRNCHDSIANVFSDIDDIYDHWNAKHKPEKFEFEIGHLIVCHYCVFISTFWEMKNHQKTAHQQSPLAIESCLNPEKCGMCNKKVDDIAEHCEKEHEMLEYTKIGDPVHMNEDLLVELSTFQCGFNAIQHLISGCCYDQIPATMNGLLYHILCHLEPINCTRCSFSSSDGFKFAKHYCAQTTSDIMTRFRRNLHDIFFDTRIVFKNGLIVSRANLIDTGYDNDQSFAFDVFINELMNIHEGANYCLDNPI